MDPREVLELVARTSSSGALGSRAAYLGSGPDGEYLGPDDDTTGGGRASSRTRDEGLVHLTKVPARDARTVPLPDELPPSLVDRLQRMGADELYVHQLAVRDHALAGQHVVVATGTASGKTLAYQLPILETILEDDRATTLYLSPTKALARDQLRALRALKLPQLRAAVVDGDTSREERAAIQKTANFLLTNPDLLHHSLLPMHSSWATFLARLKFVVIDEAHVARGVFGSHVSLIIRRLRRLCDRYGASPTFILASATIGNPAEHASTLTGVDVVAVTDDGSARGPLDLGLWQPPFSDEAAGKRRSLLRETGDLLASFVGAEIQTLAFTGSRKAAELIATFARERLGDDDPLRDQVMTYRAGYLPQERRDLETDLRAGRIMGLAATEALELGIDVAGLDAVLLAGYPGTIARFWQRLGRAGRAGAAAVGVLVAADDPLDQYLVHHPEELLGRPPEDAVIDPTNPYLLMPHLWCTAHELPIDDVEAAERFGPTAPGLLAEAVDLGRLRRRGDRHHWTSRQWPTREVDIRSAGGRDVTIIDTETGAMIGTVDGSRAPSTVHDGAIYIHQGATYEIAVLDLERGTAMAEPARNLHHTTRPRSDTDVSILGELDAMSWGPIDIRLGRVRVTTEVVGYDVLQMGSGEVLTHVPLSLPPSELDTVAVWYVLTDQLLADAGVPTVRVPGSLHAAEHAAIGLLPLIALCDRWDIGGLSTARHADTMAPTVFVYDGYPGGAGLAERSYRRLGEHLTATRATVAECRCADGCPSCVQSPKCGNGNDPLDKAGAVQVLDLLLSHQPT